MAVTDSNESIAGGGPWLDLRGAAEHLSVSKAYLCTLCTHGTGPRSIKRGRLRRFKREWLDAWLLQAEATQ